MGRIGAVEPVKRVRRATAQRAPKRPPDRRVGGISFRVAGQRAPAPALRLPRSGARGANRSDS